MSIANKIAMVKLPKCQSPDCEENAMYDCQTATGSWGYMCETHFRENANPNATHNFLYVIQKKEVKHREGVPVVMLEYEMDEWMDVTATVTCPTCGHTHNIEPDNDAEMKCHSCEQSFKCNPQY